MAFKASPKTYVLVYIGLLAILAATVTTSRLDLGTAGIWLALGFSTAKAGLVVTYFMHLREEKGVIRVAAGAGLFLLSVLFLFSLADLLTRQLTP